MSSLTLTVLYDDRCGFCERAARWLRIQMQAVPLRVVAASSVEAQRLCAMISPPLEHDELIVIADDGSVWRGVNGLLMCLWALRDYRAWSERLASPTMRPLVRRAFDVFSSKRVIVSRLLGMRAAPGTGPEDDAELLREIQARPEPTCEMN